MAYDRFDPRDRARDTSRWSDDRFRDRDRDRDRELRSQRGNPDDRGFFDRATDEVASWFGHDDAERRRRDDRMRFDRDERGRGDWNDNRGVFARGGSSTDDYSRS